VQRGRRRRQLDAARRGRNGPQGGGETGQGQALAATGRGGGRGRGEGGPAGRMDALARVTRACYRDEFHSPDRFQRSWRTLWQGQRRGRGSRVLGPGIRGILYSRGGRGGGKAGAQNPTDLRWKISCRDRRSPGRAIEFGVRGEGVRGGGIPRTSTLPHFHVTFERFAPDVSAQTRKRGRIGPTKSKELITREEESQFARSGSRLDHQSDLQISIQSRRISDIYNYWRCWTAQFQLRNSRDLSDRRVRDVC